MWATELQELEGCLSSGPRKQALHVPGIAASCCQGAFHGRELEKPALLSSAAGRLYASDKCHSTDSG